MGRKKIYRVQALKDEVEKKEITMNLKTKNIIQKIDEIQQTEEADSINFRLLDGSTTNWSKESLEKVKSHPWLASPGIVS